MPIGYPGPRQDPKSNSETGSITPRNRSSQTPQAAAQNVPQGRGMTAGAGVIAGAGHKIKRFTTGKLGKASFK